MRQVLGRRSKVANRNNPILEGDAAKRFGEYIQNAVPDPEKQRAAAIAPYMHKIFERRGDRNDYLEQLNNTQDSVMRERLERIVAGIGEELTLLQEKLKELG